MKKYIAFFAAIAATLSLAGSCSRGVDSVKTLVDENSGHTVGAVVEYNTPISCLSINKKSFDIPGYWIITAITTEKNPEEILDESKSMPKKEEKNNADDKIQVVPRKGQNLEGGESVKMPQLPPSLKGLTKDAFRGKDGKYVLLMLREKRLPDTQLALGDSTVAAKPSPEPEHKKVVVRQVQEIKTVKGKAIKAWDEGLASSETIKIKMAHRTRIHRAPPAPVKK